MSVKEFSKLENTCCDDKGEDEDDGVLAIGQALC